MIGRIGKNCFKNPGFRGQNLFLKGHNKNDYFRAAKASIVQQVESILKQVFDYDTNQIQVLVSYGYRFIVGLVRFSIYF